MATPIDKAVDALSAIAGEPTDYLFGLLDSVVETPLTKDVKEMKQHPHNPHGKRAAKQAWLDEAMEELALAQELGEL